MNNEQELRIIEKLSAIEVDTKLLRNELLGNGQPGRMKLAEDAIQELKDSRNFRSGVIYSISVLFSILTSALVAHGKELWHAVFHR